MQAEDEFDWFEDVSDAHVAELQRFRRAIRRAGEQFGFYVFVARKSLHPALVRHAVQAGVDELGQIFSSEWIDGDDLRASVEALLQREVGLYRGLVLSGDGLVSHGDATLISAINLSRERLADVIRGPLVLCFSEANYAVLPDLASDLWSARSGVFVFGEAGSIRTRAALGVVVGQKFDHFVSVPPTLVERWLEELSRKSLELFDVPTLSLWQERLAYLTRWGHIDARWLRVARQLAEHAERLRRWDAAFRFRATELACRQLAGQTVRVSAKYLEAAHGQPSHELRLLARSLEVIDASESPEHAMRDLRGLLLACPPNLTACLNELRAAWRTALAVFGPSRTLLTFLSEDLSARVPRQAFWLQFYVQLDCGELERQLGDEAGLSRRVDRWVDEATRVGDVFVRCEWLWQVMQSDTRARPTVRALDEIERTSIELGLNRRVEVIRRWRRDQSTQ